MKKSILLACALLLTAGSAMAQNSGTVNVSGAVSKSAAIRWWSYTPIVLEAGTNSPATQNGPLDFTLDVAEGAAGLNLQNYTGGTVQMIIRSNAAYTLNAQVTTSSGFGSVAAGDIALADVGFGIGNLSNSGGKVFGDPAAGSTIAAAFASDPSAAAKDVDGEPIFSATLDDASASVQVLDGPRISNRGGIGSPNNGLLVDTSYAIGPQFYTPTASFAATVTFTLATP